MRAETTLLSLLERRLKRKLKSLPLRLLKMRTISQRRKRTSQTKKIPLRRPRPRTKRNHRRPKKILMRNKPVERRNRSKRRIMRQRGKALRKRKRKRKRRKRKLRAVKFRGVLRVTLNTPWILQCLRLAIDRSFSMERNI